MTTTTAETNDTTYDPEDYYLAPQSQRAFGAGIKRKRIEFIPASTETSLTPVQSQSQSHLDAGARYLSIVLGSTSQTPSIDNSGAATPTSTVDQNTDNEHEEITPCPVCTAPTTPSTLKSHLASITHQLHLDHSHPPSHIDRSRKGLKYLEGYGWDPDGRVGLGVRNDGIRVPVRAREKRDTAGLGLFRDEGEDDGDHSVRKTRSGAAKGKARSSVEEPVVRLNAKQVRRVEEEKKKKAERLRSTFYGEDLSRYLGDGG